jgi:hypothetical protein
MGTILTATDCTRYENGVSYTDQSPLAGLHSNGANRVVRYTFTTPSSGARSYSVMLTGCSAHNGTPVLRYYLTTSDSSHTQANTTSSYDGTLTRRSTTSGYGQYEYYAASIDKLLEPNMTYYLYIFAGSATVGTAFLPCDNYQYSTNLASITLEGNYSNVWVYTPLGWKLGTLWGYKTSGWVKASKTFIYNGSNWKTR